MPVWIGFRPHLVYMYKVALDIQTQAHVDVQAHVDTDTQTHGDVPAHIAVAYISSRLSE